MVDLVKRFTPIAMALAALAAAIVKVVQEIESLARG